MNSEESIKNHNRKELKDFFRDGEIPSQNHFHSLIDSTINKHDDGISKNEDEGLVIKSFADKASFISFYKNVDDLDPYFLIEKDELKPESLVLRPVTKTKNNERESFFFNTAGNLGLGKKSNNKYRLDVNGFTGAVGRIGTFRQGKAEANGKWQTIIPALDSCQAFEIVARAGFKKNKRFAMLHAIAVSAFGKSRNRVRATSAYYGSFWSKLRIRWKSNSMNNYELQIKTNCKYRDDDKIFYTIGKLWDDDLFLHEV